MVLGHGDLLLNLTVTVARAGTVTTFRPLPPIVVVVEAVVKKKIKGEEK
jgi:hypothetical protein